jgi:hypothetical protein
VLPANDLYFILCFLLNSQMTSKVLDYYEQKNMRLCQLFDDLWQKFCGGGRKIVQ